MNTFVDKFLENVAKFPDKPAVMDIRGAYTYRKLNQRSGFLASEIQRITNGNNSRIAILLPRTKEYMTALIAVIRSGCAAVPVDSEYPEERIQSVLKDSGCAVCITTSELSRKAENFPVIIAEEVLRDVPPGEYSLNLSDASKEGLLIYTSGSTGKPKGVIHRQSIFSAGYESLKEDYSFTENDIICGMAGFTFIASTYDLIPSLIVGGSLYITNEEERKNVDSLYNIITSRHITGMYIPPQMFVVMRELYGRLPLNYVVVAGEKFKGKYPFDGNLIELYGASEACPSLIHRTGDGDPYMLGKPVNGAEVFLIDDDGKQITEPGIIGELCIVSPYLANGYNNLPEETAEKFTECPFLSGQRMYRSGDMMAFDDAGKLLFHGRKDRMIKLRGYRVELGEIETVMNKAEGITENACVSVKVSGGDKLCCYYAGKESASVILKEYAAKFLPEYMVPDYFVHLDALPRNDRNKIDYPKIQLMKPPSDDGEYIPPETDTEKRVCEIFGSVLNIDRVSAIADFFTLGGTSLSAAVLISELKHFRPEKDISFNDIASHPTVRALSEFLDGITEESSVPEMNRDFYPLTKTQMGIYLEALTGGNAATYTVPYLMKAAEGITAERIIAAVKAVISAHPSMKYVIRAGADRIPRVFMTPDAPVEIPIVDGKSEDRLGFMKRFVPVVAMTDEMLFHFAVYRTPECCYLAVKAHLIFFDGTAISLFISELNRALSGKTLTHEKITVQQAAMIEEAKMRDGSHEKAEKYYAELFKLVDDMPNLSGDIDGTLTPGVSRNMRYEPGTLTTERVKAFCGENQITESSFFLGAMSLILGKYLNTKHVTFSTVYNGRALSGQESTLGTLIKRIPVYGNLSENIPVKDFLRSISRQVFASMSNDIYSFDEVLKHCPVNEDIEFIYQGDLFTDNMGTSSGQNLIEGDSYFMEHYHTGMVTGCMSIQFFSTKGLYNMTIEYRNERFSEEYVKSFAEDFFTTAGSLLLSENISDVSMLNDDDRKSLARFNDTAVDIHFTPVHEQIHLHALENPDKIAVTSCGKSLTFRELDILSNEIAFSLREKGVVNETLAGVLLDRNVWTYAAEIGILKAGGAFVPFIPEYPDERIDFCMNDGKIPLIITSESIAAKRSHLVSNYSVITLEEIFSVKTLADVKPGEKFIAPPETETNRNSLAYVIYTSGTTGRPKGVMIEHGNIANYVHKNPKSIEIMNYAEDGRVSLALASFSFDVSVVEEFVPLCNGNSVVIATDEEIHTPSMLADLILTNGVNGITCTPSYIAGLLGIPEMNEALKQITFFDIGAEAFPSQLYDRLRDLRADSVILNVYGPTECTMGCAAEIMTDGKIITVGKPIANTKFYVSDTFGNELPAGIRGELIICGDQVGRGYVNLPDKTAASFFIHEGMRAYHSGDLAAWTDDGKIRIFGRTDNQIKLRGFRIELDEIEKVIAEYPGIKMSAVKVIKHNGADYLAGYYAAEGEISADGLREYMKSRLPEYMLPSAIMRVDAMPLTSSGKIDKRALPSPDFSELRAEYVAPETETEKLLCRAFAAAVKMPEEKVGVLDDFFELGGDSLRAMVVLSEADIDGLNAADIFQKRTPRAIAETLSERTHKKSIDEREDESRKIPHRLTPLQRQMIDVQLFRPGATMWSNMHFLARFDISVDAQRLCNALNKALQNHPSLSTAFFFNDNNELVQQYIPDLLSEKKVREISEATAEILPEILVEPFPKILNACLCRAGVFRSPKYVYMFMDVHHILMDGGSLGVLLADIVRAYDGQELKKDYYFALRQEEEENESAGKMEQSHKWFTEKYGDEVWCNIVPPDYESDNINQAGRTHRLKFTPEEVKEAESYWGVTHSVMAISAALIALSRFTGKNHVMTNWIFNNRLSPEAENAVGMLLKNLPAAARMEEISSLRGLLESVKEQVAEGIAHSEYDFMTEHYQPFVNDCMEVNLQLSINGDELDVLKPELIELEENFKSAGARLELELLENEYGDGMFDSEMEYAEGLFDRQKMEKFHDMYIGILESMIAKEENF